MVRNQMMSNTFRQMSIGIFLIASLGLLSCKKDSQEPVTCLSDYLIEPAGLSSLIEKGHSPVIIELSKPEQFKKGHIPNAFNLWRSDYGDSESYPFGGMRANPAQIANLMGELGISPKDEIILYDEKGDVDAARFMWVLRLYGHEKIRLLNGGKTAWESEGRKLVLEIPVKKVHTYKLNDNNSHHEAIKKEDVLAAVYDSTYTVIDSRTLEEYSGEMLKKGAKKAGRIPNSIHLNWIETVNAHSDYRFKPCEDIEKILKEAGINSDKKIITYCHSGVRSAHLAFVLTELLGFEFVRNYDGSWTEWSHFDELPFESDSKIAPNEINSI